jgi:hypothetical protein
MKLEEPTLKYEYQTLEMPFSFGIMKPQLPVIAGALNEQGREDWQLKQVILPSAQLGSSDRLVLILRPGEPSVDAQIPVAYCIPHGKNDARI